MKYLYKILVIVIIISYSILPVIADETEWVDPQEKTLRLKESFSRDGFIIEASDFYDNSALITVYDSNRSFVTRNITRIDDYIVVGRLNISVMNIQEVTGNIDASLGLNRIVDQWVRIKTRVVGNPLIKISIIPKSIEINDKAIIRRTFIPDSEIPINFSVRNEGKAKLKNIILKINTLLPVLYGDKLNYEILELGSGNESEVITVRFKAPPKEERKLFLISAEAIGFDVFEKASRATDSINIEVNSMIGKKIEIKKYISEKIYFGDVGVVSISIKNNMSRRIDNLTLTDSLPAGLEPIDAKLKWNFTLLPDELKTISYNVKPQQPGTYYLQSGTSIIGYKNELYYNNKTVKLIVNGPYVMLTKSASPDELVKGDKITIRLDAENIGNSNAIVKLKDSVPANNSLPAQSYKEVLNTIVLHPGNSTSFSYILNTTVSGNYVIPQAKATVLDQFLYQEERYSQEISSNELLLNVKETIVVQPRPLKVAITPQKTDNPRSTRTPAVQSTTSKPVPGFQGNDFLLVFTVIILLLNRFSRDKL